MKRIDFSKIETYLFDLGGVVIDIDPLRTIEAFSQLGLPHLKEQINHGHHEGLFKQLEKGQISEATFIKEIRLQLTAQVGDNEIVDAWNKMLIHCPTERIALLKQLKKDKPVYLLSNTNGIHRACFTTMAEGHNAIEELFTQVFYSYQLGCSKPDAEPFEKVIELTGLNPESTLFLDDSQANIETAERLGFKTALVTPHHSMQKILRDQ